MTTLILLADYDGAANGFTGIIGVLWILLCFIYGVICFLVPIFIYRIMRRGTESYDALCRIEQLLQAQTPAAKPLPEFGTERPKKLGEKS
jgi:hypothetical protein